MSKARFFVCGIIRVNKVFFCGFINETYGLRKALHHFIPFFFAAQFYNFFDRFFQAILENAIHFPLFFRFPQMLDGGFDDGHNGAII